MDDNRQPWQNPPESPTQQPGSAVPASAEPSWDQISGQPSGGQSPRSRSRMVAAGLIAAVLIVAVVSYALYHNGKSDDFANRIRNGSGTSNIAPAREASADTPLGQTARGSGGAAGLAIKVEQVLPGPQTEGDAPDAGTVYLEIDMSVSNGTRDLMIVPGTFYYRADAGKLVATATSTGDPKYYPNKNVRIAGKESLDGLSLPAGQTDAKHYLIFQVPSSDKAGKLIWYDGYYDPDSTRLAVFDLD